MRSVEQMIEELKAAKGLEPADLVLLHAKLVMLHTEEIIEGCLYIKNGRIVSLQERHCLPAAEQFDCQGRYVLPGLIDAHVHIEPTLLTPEALAAVIVPLGTTTMLVDGMEMGNVAGTAGVEALMQNALREGLNYNLWLQVPSRVPSAPGLETTGGELGLDEVKGLLEQAYSVSVGELDPSKVLSLRKDYLEKVLMAQRMGKISNGHAAGLKWDELNVYACAGLQDDHECLEYEELLQRLRLGLRVMIREGSAERNLEALLGGVLKDRLPLDELLFCTDDKHVNDIYHEGHINYMVNKAIALGVPPIKAIKMATLNTAKHFRMDHLIGSVAPGRWADLIVTEDLARIDPVHVFFHGRHVAENGRMLASIARPDYPQELRRTIRLSTHFSGGQFKVASAAASDSVKVRVIHLYPNQIVNFGSVETLQAVDGEIKADANRDILKLAVVERYGRTGDVGVGFVKGFGLKSGALACSVAHDHHNIVVVGSNDEDMELAVRTIERYQGGFAAVDGGVVQGVLALPIGGLMSDLGAEEVIEQLEHLNEVVKMMGCRLRSPFMALSFISLPTVPELGMTDKGLVDVKSHSIIPVLI